MMGEFVKETMRTWRGRKLNDMKKAWRALQYCVFWTIWKARNGIAFEVDTLEHTRDGKSHLYLICGDG